MSVAVVFKSPYVKGGKAAGKAGYIARRIGVDKSINNKVVINANYIATRQAYMASRRRMTAALRCLSL